MCKPASCQFTHRNRWIRASAVFNLLDDVLLKRFSCLQLRKHPHLHGT